MKFERGAATNSGKMLMRFSQRRLPLAKLKPTPFLLTVLAGSLLLAQLLSAAGGQLDSLDRELTARLQQLGFSGKIAGTLEQRLGRPVDPARANLGRLLWFDTISGLNNDNSCAGCHSPTRGF